MRPNATAYQRSQPYPVRLEIDRQGNPRPALDWDIPFRGQVIGSLLQAPVAPPARPEFFLKPATAVIPDGTPIPLPGTIPEVEIHATLGLVLGRPATRVAVDEALEYLQGYVVVSDIREPAPALGSPALRQLGRDGFCPAGGWIIDREQVPDPGALEVYVYINGQMAARSRTAAAAYSAARLLAEVSACMSLQAGDVLLLGTLPNLLGPLPRARSGDLVSVEIPRVGMLSNPVVPEAPA